MKASHQRKRLVRAPGQARTRSNVSTSTPVGMGFSNLMAIAIIVTTAATLNTNGITDVETSADAAKALEPVAGEFAFILFGLGIIGTGMFAMPVLAGSAGYALGEAGNGRWVSLGSQPRRRGSM